MLVDCVAGGASVSFMASLTPAAAADFFRSRIEGIENGGVILLAAFAGGKLAGTVQVLTRMPPNQPHRAELSKLLVTRSARGAGVGSLLVQRAEREARAAGKTLLTLDTVTGGDGERLYRRLGWTPAGMIPRFAQFPDGTWTATTIFWKDLAAADSDTPPAAFTFIDLFAGIGGFRIALEKLGGQCRFSCEWDRYARKTYAAWFGEEPFGDIRDLDRSLIPDHDLLAAGFPCQPFSLAGVSKKNSLGREHGFKCDTQGTLFFELASIMEAKRPRIAILENVKNLRSHDRGKTWTVIRLTLEELDYWVFSQVIDAAGWVPQHRERVYIVCFDKRLFPEPPDFQFPQTPEARPALREILEPEPDPKYTLTPHLWNYLQNYAAKHRAKGNGFGFGIADPAGVARTLSARYHKDGSEILIQNGGNAPPRRLTPRECARLMGFDSWCEDNIVVSDTQAYRQFGNAVSPRVVEALGRQILKVSRQ